MTLLEEAKKRYKPGMRVKCTINGEPGTVWPHNKWFTRSDSVIIGGEEDDGVQIRLYVNGRWAEIITEPAIGLQEGDACECSPAMRAAIVELAKELGFSVVGVDPQNEYVLGVRYDGDSRIVTNRPPNPSTAHSFAPEAFITKMRVTANAPKPIKIGEHPVKFSKGSIAVGCTTIDNATVRAIADKLID